MISPTINIIPTMTFHMRIFDVEGFIFVITIPDTKNPITIPIRVNGPKNIHSFRIIAHDKFIEFSSPVIIVASAAFLWNCTSKYLLIYVKYAEAPNM